MIHYFKKIDGENMKPDTFCRIGPLNRLKPFKKQKTLKKTTINQQKGKKKTKHIDNL